jgi:hypothetical protein
MACRSARSTRRCRTKRMRRSSMCGRQWLHCSHQSVRSWTARAPPPSSCAHRHCPPSSAVPRGFVCVGAVRFEHAGSAFRCGGEKAWMCRWAAQAPSGAGVSDELARLGARVDATAAQAESTAATLREQMKQVAPHTLHRCRATPTSRVRAPTHTGECTNSSTPDARMRPWDLTSAPRPGSPRSTSARDLARPCHICTQDWVGCTDA